MKSCSRLVLLPCALLICVTLAPSGAEAWRGRPVYRRQVRACYRPSGYYRVPYHAAMRYYVPSSGACYGGGAAPTYGSSGYCVVEVQVVTSTVTVTPPGYTAAPPCHVIPPPRPVTTIDDRRCEIVPQHTDHTHGCIPAYAGIPSSAYRPEPVGVKPKPRSLFDTFGPVPQRTHHRSSKKADSDHQGD